jgi:hypothetical protein
MMRHPEYSTNEASVSSSTVENDSQPQSHSHSRDLAADIHECQSRLHAVERTIHRMLDAAHRPGVAGEERVEIFKAIHAHSNAQTEYALLLRKLVPLYHQRQLLGGCSHINQRGANMADTSSTSLPPTRTPVDRHERSLSAEVWNDATKHHIRMYIDSVFVPSALNLPDDELKRKLEEALDRCAENGTFWYETEWSFVRDTRGLLIKFKVLPESAAAVAEIFIAWGAVSTEFDGAPDPATWHGKRYVSHELQPAMVNG